MGGSGEVLLPLESVGCDQGEPRPQLGHPRVRAVSPVPDHQGWTLEAQSLWTAVRSVLSHSGFFEGRVSYWLVGPTSRDS